jgi:gamma-glutamyltranspeptidase/glutathione hydrolase
VSPSKSKSMTRSDAMIVAPQPEAVEAGALVLRNGGNAVDAAITCALVQGVVDPQMCGLAGFGSMQLYLPERGVHEMIDFHGRAPSAATSDMWADLIEGENRDGFGFVLRGRVNDVGYQSITVPGSLKAYYEAQTQYGVLPWAKVVEPAIAHADEGFVVRPHVYAFWTRKDDSDRVPVAERLRHTEAARKIYYDDRGDLNSLGSRIHNPDMARTLRRVAVGGAEIFYRGEIADEIAADMERGGGLLRREDLEDYKIERSDPLWGEYRGRRIATNSPPGGGLMLIEMLHMLENFDLRSMGHNSPEYIRIVSEVMKRATIDKDRWIGDPRFFDVPVARLVDPAYAAQLAKDILAGEIAHVERVGSPESRNTTHISVLDSTYNAVSMTHSLGMPSGVVSEGLGFMYNGCMGVFDPRPGHADSIEPGKSRFSSICPSIVFEGDDPVMVVGAPGGTQIAMGVLQSILNVIDHGMSVSDAVAAPRFSATSDAIDVCNRIPRYVTIELEQAGYSIVRSPLSHTFAWVHAIQIKEGAVTGGADPGADGMALSVPA